MKYLEYRCTVTGKQPLTPTVFQLQFVTEPDLQFVGGQFVSIVIPGASPEGRDLRRAYSLASSPSQRPYELCIKRVKGGPGTTYLDHLAIGACFTAVAPYGDFVFKTARERQVFFIATGSGIAPFRAMMGGAEYQQAPPVLPPTCLLGVRSEDEVLYDSFFQAQPQARWVPMVSQPTHPTAWTGQKGRVTDYLRALGKDFPWEQADFYLCGNGQMIKEVKGILFDHQVLKTAIHQEIYFR